MSVTAHNVPNRRDQFFYRLALFSANAISLGPNGQDATFFIDIPESLPLSATESWQFAPEYFVTNSTVTPTSLLVNVTNLTQPNTYNTMTQSTNFTIMIIRSSVYQRYIDFNSIGYPIANINFMRGGRLSITMTDITGAPITYGQMNGNWGIILVIYRVPWVE